MHFPPRRLLYFLFRVSRATARAKVQGDGDGGELALVIDGREWTFGSYWAKALKGTMVPVVRAHVNVPSVSGPLPVSAAATSIMTWYWLRNVYLIATWLLAEGIVKRTVDRLWRLCPGARRYPGRSRGGPRGPYSAGRCSRPRGPATSRAAPTRGGPTQRVRQIVASSVYWYMALADFPPCGCPARAGGTWERPARRKLSAEPCHNSVTLTCAYRTV